MVKDDHRPLGERQRGEGVGDRVDGEVALGLLGGLRTGIGDVSKQIELSRRPGRG